MNKKHLLYKAGSLSLLTSLSSINNIDNVKAFESEQIYLNEELETNKDIVSVEDEILLKDTNNQFELGDNDTQAVEQESDVLIVKDNIEKDVFYLETTIDNLDESTNKDLAQDNSNSRMSLNRETVSANLDVYIKSKNMLSMSLDTNSVTFENYSGAEDMEKLGAVNITIDSSLPYQLNAYMPSEIANTDKSEIIPIDILNIRDASQSAYQKFTNTTDKVVLKDNCVKGNDLVHNIDLKLSTNLAHKADVYKTVIKFEAEQK